MAKVTMRALLPATRKAHTEIVNSEGVTERIPLSVQMPEDPFAGLYGSTEDGVPVPQQPPIEFEDLAETYGASSILPQCGWAVGQMVEGQGWDLQETIKVDVETPDDVKAAMTEERRRLRSLLQRIAGAGSSLVQELLRSREDLEVLGWRVLEVLRIPNEVAGDAPEGAEFDPLGSVAGLQHVPAHTFRWSMGTASLLVDDWFLEEGDLKAGRVPIYVKRKAWRRFRLLLHMRSGKTLFYRQFGDPRIVDSESGRVLGRYDVEGDQERAAVQCPRERWANEVLVQVRYFPLWEPYGRPWWHGVATTSMGIEAAEEANLGAIQSPEIPRLIITSEGEATDASAMDRIAEQVEEGRKEDPTAHARMLLVETTPHRTGDPETGTDRMQRSMLNVHQIKVLPDDGLFVPFDEAGRKKCRSARGLSAMSVGLADEYTYASAKAALDVEERLVYQPEREALELMIGQLLTSLRARWWQWVTKKARIAAPEDVSTMVEQAEKGGGLTPNLHRKLLAEVSGADLNPITESWGDAPFAVTLAQVNAGLSPGFTTGVLDEGEDPSGDAAGAPATKSTKPTGPSLAGIVHKLLILRGEIGALRQRTGPGGR